MSGTVAQRNSEDRQQAERTVFSVAISWAIDGELTLAKRFRFWRLAAIVSAQTPLSEEVRNAWPDLVSSAPFIQAMGESMDLSESFADMQMRIGLSIAEYIGDGPFMAGQKNPTMLDLVIFPQLVFGFLFGL